MTDLNKRNAESVFQALKDQDALVRQMMTQVQGLSAAVGGFNERLLLLEREAAERRVKQMGHGPTQYE